MNHTLPVPREEDILWRWNGYDTTQFSSSYDFDSNEASFTGSFSMSVENDETNSEDLQDFCLKISVTNSIGMKLWHLTQFTQSRVSIFIEFTSSSIGSFDSGDGFQTDQLTKYAMVGVTNGSGGVNGNGLLFHWRPKANTGHGLCHLATGSIFFRRFSGDSTAPFTHKFCRIHVNKCPTSGSLFYRMYYFGNGISQQYTHNSYSVPTAWNANQDINTACFGIYMTGSSLRHGNLYIKKMYVTKHPFDIE